MIEIITNPAILATLISGLILFQINRFIVFRNSCNIFRNIFLSELKDIYPLPVNWPQNIDVFLRSKFTNLQTAIDEFKSHLPKRKRRAFHIAWIKYYNEYEQEDWQCYLHYMPLSGTSIENGKKTTYDNTKTYKKNFKHNVDNLLKYAKQT